MVDSLYVSFAAELYTKKWEKEFEKRSRRIMLQPHVGRALIHGIHKPHEKERLVERFASLIPCASKKLGLVFVPFLMDEHWICVLFSFRDKSIRLIDSLFNDPLGQHEKEINHLIEGMDSLLKRADGCWVQGNFENWLKLTVVLHQQDISSCGVMMLACIMSCADRLKLDYKVDDIARMREKIIIDDVLSDFNEKKDDLPRWAKSSMKQKMEDAE